MKNIITINAFSGYIQIPILITETYDNMGIMIPWNGDAMQIDEAVNFLYKIEANTLTIYNSLSPDNNLFSDAVFTIFWGDGTSSYLPLNNTTFSSISKTYSSNDTYEVSILVENPFNSKSISKSITIPQNIVMNDIFGVYSGFTVPYSTINDLELNYQNNIQDDLTENNTIFFYASGKSRIEEKRRYDGVFDGVIDGVFDGVNYKEYTIDGLIYRDFDDGSTIIIGDTGDFTKEEIINKKLIRDEILLGFTEKINLFSDILIERDEVSVLKNNIALTEINNIGELINYGNSFFKIKKQ